MEIFIAKNLKTVPHPSPRESRTSSRGAVSWCCPTSQPLTHQASGGGVHGREQRDKDLSGPVASSFSFLCRHLSPVFECLGLARGWHLTLPLGHDWLILCNNPTSPTPSFSPFLLFQLSFSLSCVWQKEGKFYMCLAEEWDHYSPFLAGLLSAGWGYREKAGQLHFHREPSGSARLTRMLICWFPLLILFCWWGCSQGPLHCSCRFRPGPSEGEGVFGIMSSEPSSPCRCQHIIVIIGGSM